MWEYALIEKRIQNWKVGFNQLVEIFNDHFERRQRSSIYFHFIKGERQVSCVWHSKRSAAIEPSQVLLPCGSEKIPPSEVVYTIDDIDVRNTVVTRDELNRVYYEFYRQAGGRPGKFIFLVISQNEVYRTEWNAIAAPIF